MNRSIQGTETQASRADSFTARPAARDPLVETMRRHLVAARPQSGNEALRLLRSAFPHVPLASRVEAAGAIGTLSR